MQGLFQFQESLYWNFTWNKPLVIFTVAPLLAFKVPVKDPRI